MNKIGSVIVLLALISFVACDPYDPSDYTHTPTPITYEITGTATLVDVTLNNATGGTEQYDDVSVPHTYSYADFTDSFLYISAQNQNATGSVTVSIYRHNVLFKTATSSGAYVIATASGSN